jgi:alpha-ribazole phosphatase/probable phosphoglycerate mutase
MKKIIIDLLRHGDVAGGKRLLGRTDEPLSKLGWQQMREISCHADLPWQKIISSPLVRCSSFAKELSHTLSKPLVIEDNFQEINFGLWDGQSLSNLYQSDESEPLKQFMFSPSSITPPNGEHYNDFECRVISAWNVLLTTLKYENINHCLLLTHAGVIRTILSHTLEFPETNLFRLDVPYACLSRIVQYDDYPAILHSHNAPLEKK